MDLNQLHFAHPLWLWLGTLIPITVVLFCLFYRPQRLSNQLERFIDSHLLPHLLLNGQTKKTSAWKMLLLWSVSWACLTLALAGPRWSYQEIETFSKDQSLVVLLDLSESMNAADVKPTRLVLAKQKIEDLLNAAQGVKIGLVAFAADPHMITPLTDDKETVRHLLPSLTTALVYVQGSRLSSAIDMAAVMLNAEPGSNKSLLLISDGGFEDASAMTTAKTLAEKGVVIHAMGVGTIEGAPIQDYAGNVIKKNGAALISKLETEKLREISRMGKGHYFDAYHGNQAELIVLEDLEKRAAAQLEMGKKSKVWDERFYLFLFPVIPILLWWLRRGYIFAVFAISLSISSVELNAFDSDYFKNDDQKGLDFLEEGNYKAAAELFQDNYRKGVALYKAGDFSEAEKLFRQSSREEVETSAAYNLGNALAMQQKIGEAIAAYEEVLKKWPDHINAKENLELLKKFQQEKEQDSSDTDNKDENKENEDQTQDGKESQDQNSQDSDQDKSSDNDKKSRDSKNSSGQEETKPDKEQDKKPEQKPTEDQQKEQAKEQSTPDQKNQTQENQNNGDKQGSPPPVQPKQAGNEIKMGKAQEDLDADQWLNRVTNDPTQFLQNKFYLESKRNGTMEGIDPW